MTDKYCLSSFIDYSTSIHEPLKHSNRIKYSCFDISPNYLVFGATSGSLYLFNRRTAKFLHLIPNKHGSVSHLAISANEKYVAFGTLRSIICVYTINLSANATPQVIYTNLSTDQSVQLTCLRWTQDEKQFYYGDSKGLVNMVLLSSFIGRGLINMTVHTILFLESPIVQIDVFESLLLVSSCSKCVLCNTEFEDYKQIGNRPREGFYGACFAVSTNEATQPSRIYCARPGSRLWEADFEGDVIQTHQFRAALAIAPSKIYKFDLETKGEIDNRQYCDYQSAKYDENHEMLDYQPQNLQFSKLQMLTSDFLLTFTELGLYVFDVHTSKVVLWCNQFERIVDCRVSGENILIFAQTGSLYSVELCSLQAQVCRLVQDDMLLECAFLMRKHVKYFADKARDDYSLSLLKEVKNFLIDRQQYELLNDLSVIFDAIVQCAGDGDNNSSGGSSGGTGDRSSLGASGGNYKLGNNEQYIPSSKGVYVLENAFCDNLKNQKSAERHLKDTLLTVTGKFGKNIIKYKFSIFADEQEKLVSDLIPSSERSLPFKDINVIYEQQDDDIVRLRKSRNPTRTGKNSSSQSIQEHQQQQHHITTEEKTLYNLYLIFKSAKISNTNCVERYRALFDEYSAREIIVLLSKLQSVMQEYGDSLEQAQKNCYEMYLNYLNPELIWEMDDVSRDYIATGFKKLNTSDDIVRCDNCLFPLRFDNSCQFHAIGNILLRYYWTRNEQAKCFDVLTHVPALLDVLATFYLNEQRMEKVLPIVLNYGQPELLFETGKYFSLADWSRCFQQFVDMQMGRLTCVNCACITVVQNVNRHFFYTWNCFLSIAMEHMKVSEILALILKWSHCIPNDAIDREFYTKCLLKG